MVRIASSFLRASGFMSTHSVQARYEVLRLRMRALRLQLLSLLTENVPFIGINTYILVRSGCSGSNLFIFGSLCTSILSCGFKLCHADQLRDTWRKKHKLRTILAEGGVHSHPVRGSLLPRQVASKSGTSPLVRNPLSKHLTAAGGGALAQRARDKKVAVLLGGARKRETASQAASQHTSMSLHNRSRSNHA